MKKTARLLFCLFALIACFQLIGLEEAFCEDSVLEAGCQECTTCSGHQFTGSFDLLSLPGITFSGYLSFNYFTRQIEQPPLNLLRPPIAR